MVYLFLFLDEVYTVEEIEMDLETEEQKDDTEELDEVEQVGKATSQQPNAFTKEAPKQLRNLKKNPSKFTLCKYL